MAESKIQRLDRLDLDEVCEMIAVAQPRLGLSSIIAAVNTFLACEKI